MFLRKTKNVFFIFTGLTVIGSVVFYKLSYDSEKMVNNQMFLLPVNRRDFARIQETVRVKVHDGTNIGVAGGGAGGRMPPHELTLEYKFLP